MIDEFEGFVKAIEPVEHQEKVRTLLEWVNESYQGLKPVFKWKQPMYTHHGTFIIAFSVASKHISVGFEGPEIKVFAKAIKDAGYKYSKKNFRIPFDQAIDYDLLSDMIEFNVNDKKHITTFWRP